MFRDRGRILCLTPRNRRLEELFRQSLFAPGGPTEHNVDQNGAADCYLLAALSSLARVAPDRITDGVADLGDGTYAVHFEKRGQHSFVRTDADLAVDGAGRPWRVWVQGAADGSAWDHGPASRAAFFGF